MPTELLIYEVSSNDTLDSVAQKNGMSGDELRDFHNANCQQVGLHFFNSMIGIQKLVIPKNYKSAEQLRKEITDAIPPGIIFPNFYAHKYQVIESYESDFEDKLEISYKLDIQLEKSEKINDGSFVAFVHCYDFKKNREKPDDKMSELSIACAESIAPIQLIISSEGKISEIFQFEKLRAVFDEKRKNLEEFFIGDVSKKYMDQFAKSLSDEKYFEKQIRSTLLYEVLFPSMAWFYKESSWKEDFYLVKNSFALKILLNGNCEHINSEEIRTNLRGEIDETVSLQQILNGNKFDEEIENPAVGLVELKYTTNKTTKQLLTAEAGIALLQEGEIYRKQKIKLSKISN